MDFPDAWWYRKIFDKNPKNINWEYYAVRQTLIPSYNSIKSETQWLQFWQKSTKTSLKLTYDFGDPHLNQEVYGSVSPPEYDLSKIKEKLTLYMGRNDNYLPRKDVDLLVSSMANADVDLIYLPVWGHSGLMFPKSKDNLMVIINRIKKEIGFEGD